MDAEAVKMLLDKQTELITAKIDTVVKAGDDRHATLLTELKTGFPAGDLDLHRIAHEQMIKDAQWRDGIKVEAQKKLLTGGIGAIFAGLAYILVDFFKAHTK
jgi:hypothetical protein